MIPLARPLPLAELLVSGTASSPAATAGARLVVRACLLELGAADRMLVELQLFHGWSREEIAHLSGGTPLEVSRALGRVLERLGQRMGESRPEHSLRQQAAR